MRFRVAYKERKPFSVVTHDGRTVVITHDQVNQYLSRALGDMSTTSILTGEDIDAALTKVIAETIGSKAGDGKVESYRMLRSWITTPELKYVNFIPAACVARAIQYPTEHTMEVLAMASKYLGRDLVNISIQGVNPVYADWLAVECQMHLLQPFQVIKARMEKNPPATTFVNEIPNIVGKFLAPSTRLKRLDVSQPMYEIEGHPDVTLTILGFQERKVYYNLSSVNGSATYATDAPNQIVSLLSSTHVMYRWEIILNAVYDRNIIFTNTDDLVKLGEAAYRMYESSRKLDDAMTRLI